MDCLKNYKLLKKIGKGGFAEVYEAEYLKSDHRGFYAIKKISKEKLSCNENLRKYVQEEITIHSSLDHPHIVKFYAAIEDESYQYFVLELWGESLQDCLDKRRKGQPFSEDEAREIFMQVVEAVKYLHDQDILHRDLSLRNILLNTVNQSLKVKIADFGLSTQLDSPYDIKYSRVGTLSFMPPPTEFHSKEKDIWSLGCVLFALLDGKPPTFEIKRIMGVTKVYDNKYIRQIMPPGISLDAAELILAMLEEKPSVRIKIKAVMEHSFLRNYKSSHLKSKSNSNYDSGNESLSPICSKNSHQSHGNLDSGLDTLNSRNKGLKSSRSSVSKSKHSSNNTDVRPKWKNCNEITLSGNAKQKKFHSGSNLFQSYSRCKENNHDSCNETEKCQDHCCKFLHSLFGDDKMKTSESVAPSCETNFDCEPVSHLNERKQPFTQSTSSISKHGSFRTTVKDNESALSPLNAVRLEPKRYKMNDFVISITEDRKVCFEKLKWIEEKQFVSRVYIISIDGLEIFVYKPEHHFIVGDKPPSMKKSETKKFLLDNLPKAHWKVYTYIKKVVDFLRAKTRKITIHGKEAKFFMMENSPNPNFEMEFYDGWKIIENSNQAIIIDNNGTTYAAEEIRDVYLKSMWKKFLLMKKWCQNQEKRLEKETNEFASISGGPIFPVVYGKINALVMSKNDRKKNESPQSIRMPTCSRTDNNFISGLNASKEYSTSKPFRNSQESLSPHYETDIRDIREILSDLQQGPVVVGERISYVYKDGFAVSSCLDGSNKLIFNPENECIYNPEKKIRHLSSHLAHRFHQDLLGILKYQSEKANRVGKHSLQAFCV